MLNLAGCAACKGKQVFQYYMIERPDGIHMIHVEAMDCPLCHVLQAPDPFLLQGWIQISEDEFNRLNNDPSYGDIDV